MKTNELLTERKELIERRNKAQGQEWNEIWEEIFKIENQIIENGDVVKISTTYNWSD